VLIFYSHVYAMCELLVMCLKKLCEKQSVLTG